MFIDVAMAAVQSEHRRQTLLDEARKYRLAALARTARRAARRAADHDLGEVAVPSALATPDDCVAQVSV